MSFEIPNPYKGNYKLLIIIPLLLVAVSLFFIPSIKKGVDFKGGTLVTMQSDVPADTQKLAEALEANGFSVSSAKSLQNPKGYEIEVEIERDENLTRTDELKSEFFNTVEEVSRLEADASTANNSSSEAQVKYADAKAKIDVISNGIFAIAGMPQDAEKANSTNALKASVNGAYRKIIDGNSERLSAVLSKEVPYESASFNEVSASLSAKFLEKALNVVMYSTILVCIVVFLIFRSIVPSAAVIVGAVCDIIIALGAMGMFGIPLTLASFAALLMLVGFSLDTDVLLTMRVIKRKEGDARTRAYEAMKTGMTMSMALLLSFICLFILASLTHINTYYEISAVAIAGLVGDLFATWLLNAIIVLNYAEKHGHSGESERGIIASLFSN
ncbi:MAG: hypothetical protein WCT52_00135 [Candidatus Micrarchaeia archaeon]